MERAKTISRGPPARHALDYQGLLREGIDAAQTLSGDHWSDYNLHDPGVTILEHLCFALADLAYRTNHPIEDLLASSLKGRWNGSQGTEDAERPPIGLADLPLHTGDVILTGDPLTETDVRKRIYDAVYGVKNAWLETLDPAEGAGRLRVLVQRYPPLPGLAGSLSDEKIEDDVSKVVCEQRPLGEVFAKVCVLKSLAVIIVATIEVEAGANPESVLADALIAVDDRLNPAPAVRDIGNALHEGHPPEAIFDGPALELGYIENDSLQPMRTDVPRDLVIDAMLGVAQVLRVEIQDLRVEDGHTGPSIPEISRNPSDIAKIAVLQAGRRRVIDPELTASRIAHKEQTRRHDIIYSARRLDKAHYRRVELGNAHRHLARYRSIQHLFPSVYGLGRHGVSGIVGATAVDRLKRRGRARQLKAYLLIFEQLVADAGAQLEMCAGLLSSAELSATYATNPLASRQEEPDHPPDIASVLGARPHLEGGLARPRWLENYLDKHAEIVATRDPHLDRRERALDHLLARFNEHFDNDRLLRLSGQRPWQIAEVVKGRIAAKEEFLRDVAALGGARARGEPTKDSKSIPLERRVRLLTCGKSGTDDESRFFLVEHVLLAEHAKGIGDMSVGSSAAANRLSVRASEPGPGAPAGQDPPACTCGAEGCRNAPPPVHAFAARLREQVSVHGVLDDGGTPVSWWTLAERLHEACSAAVPQVRPADGGGFAMAINLREGGTVHFVERFASHGEARETLEALTARLATDAGAAAHIRPAVMPAPFFAARLTALQACPAYVETGGELAAARADFVAETLRRAAPAHLALAIYAATTDEIACFASLWARRVADARTSETVGRMRRDAARLRDLVHRFACRDIILAGRKVVS